MKLLGKKYKFYADVMASHDGVTSSCILVTFVYPDGTKEHILIDCGNYQEKQYEEVNKKFYFVPKDVQCVVVTHVHADHIGRLPLLAKQGFDGKVYGTKETLALLPIALEDSVKLQKLHAKQAKRNPLYQKEDVERLLHQIVAVTPKRWGKLTEHVSAMFVRNGHLAGSASIVIQAEYPGEEPIYIVATGDYKKENLFFETDDFPEWLTKEEPVTVLTESTYGDTVSTDIPKTFEENVASAIAKGGTVVVPVFAIGRSQEILYVLKSMQDKGSITRKTPVFFVGNLAARYTKMYIEELEIKEEMKDLLPRNLTWLSDTKSIEEKARNSKNGAVIVTTSGMGSFGPAQTIIPMFLSDPNALIHFTGYTAEGTLGRRLLEAEKGKVVKINGKPIVKRAEVKTTGEFSSHAKADELLAFLTQFKGLKTVLINHGEPNVKLAFEGRIQEDPSCTEKNTVVLDRDKVVRLGRYGMIKVFPSKLPNPRKDDVKAKKDKKKKRVKIR